MFNPRIIFVFLGIPGLFFPGLVSVRAQSADLRTLIEEKARVLEEIQKQKDEVAKNLNQTESLQKNLSKEIKNLDSTVNHLDLTIRANKILIEKLGLEQETLTGDIQDIEANVQRKKETINKVMVALQEKRKENLMTIFLRHKTLAESISETKNLVDLQQGLTQGIRDLEIYQEELSGKIGELFLKKKTTEIEKINLTNRQVILSDQKKEKEVVLQTTRAQQNVYEKQLSELEKIQAEISAEVDKIETELRKNIDPNLLPLARPGVLAWPVPEGRLTQNYGRTPFAIKTYKNQYHNGIDIGRFLGAEIVAAEGGVIINAGNQDNYCRGGAYGKFVVIKHENGLTTLYGHLSQYIVKVGERVEREQLIGYMGHSGWAYGNHLHFTVFASNTLSPARPGLPEGTQTSRVCGPMPVGGDIDPFKYVAVPR